MNELIQKILEGKHNIVETDFITYPELGSNIDVMKFVVEKNPNLIKYIKLWELNLKKLDKLKLLKKAIDKGLNLSKEEIKNSELKNDDDIMMELIKLNPNFVEVAYHFESLFDFAIANGYNPKFIKIRDNKILLKFSKLYNYLLKNDSDLYNNVFLKEFYKRNDIQGMNLENIDEIWDFISNNTIYEFMNYNDILQAVKYIYLGQYYNLKEKFNELLKNRRYKEFNEIINILISNTNININSMKDKFDLMNDIIDKFDKYYKLCCSFISSDYTKKDVYLLESLLLSNEDKYNVKSIDEFETFANFKSIDDFESIVEMVNYYNKYKLETINDLKKYNELLYEKRKEKILEAEAITLSEGLDVYREIIISMLFNMNYESYQEKISNGFSSNDIDELINNLKNPEARDDLNKYKIIIKFIEKILKIQDEKTLKAFSKRLNVAVYKNSEAVINIYNVLRNIESIKKYYYGLEISEKLLDISKLETTPEEILKDEKEKKKQVYIKEDKKYTCPNIEIYGKNLHNEKVDYIEMNGMEFTFFVHVLNAYGDGGRLEYFKKPILIGQTYICVSPITDNNYFGFVSPDDIKAANDYDYVADKKLLTNDYEHVKLIFSTVSPEQLVAMGNHDLGSESYGNDLYIELKAHENYAPIRKNVASTKSYCEYVLYREDNRGQNIYPNAVFSTNEEPSQAEIIAAAYLQIPILHINNKYLKRKNQTNYTSQPITNLKSHENIKQQLKEMKNILCKGFKNSEASIIPEGRKK